MEEDIPNYSPTVMFRGTPCNSSNNESTKKGLTTFWKFEDKWYFVIDY